MLIDEDAQLLQRLHREIGNQIGAARRGPLYELHKELALRLAEYADVRAALLPFARMHRDGTDPKEHACVRGVASDMTVITSGDFAKAAMLLNYVHE